MPPFFIAFVNNSGCLDLECIDEKEGKSAIPEYRNRQCSDQHSQISPA
jgi:hypothetical protein